eukprot:364369-Chlamydomonas_euryale.AAC.5
MTPATCSSAAFMLHTAHTPHPVLPHPAATHACTHAHTNKRMHACMHTHIRTLKTPSTPRPAAGARPNLSATHAIAHACMHECKYVR